MAYQTRYISSLTADLSISATTISVKALPTATAGRMALVNGNIYEWISYTGISAAAGSAGNLTGVTRMLSQTADPATGGTGLFWGAGTTIFNTAMHDQLVDKTGNNTFSGTGTFTGAITTPDLSFTGTTTAGLKVKSLTTTQRDAVSNAANGDHIYNTTTGEHQVYQAGAWVTLASGSTQPNASTTVAGKVEIATTAESIAGTDTGGTGALLTVLPSDLAKNAQSGTFVYGTDVGGDDTYVVVLTPASTTNTNGSRQTFTPTTTNTGACSVNFGGGVLNVKTKDGNDPQNGVLRALTPVSGTMYGSLFILDNEDFATTANKGVVEMATDAEATAGADTSRYTNPSQLALVSNQSVNASENLNTYTTYQLPFHTTSSTVMPGWTQAGSPDFTAAGYSTFIQLANPGAGAVYIATLLPGTLSTFNASFAVVKVLRVKWRAMFTATTEIRGMGIVVAGTTIYTAHTDVINGTARFLVNAGVLYAHNANGSTATATDITSGVTLSNWNTFEMVITPGTNILFYVNGTLKATHTTNLPTSGGLQFAFGHSVNNKNSNFSAPIFSTEN